MSSLKITIDMDRRCSRCRHKGATQNGLCIQCAMKDLAAGLRQARMQNESDLRAVREKP